MAEELNELTKVAMAVAPVLAGGLIGICGSFGVNYLQQREKRFERVAAKSEEALKYIYESLTWLQDFRKNCLIDEQLFISDFPPLGLAEAIITLHIPKAELKLDAFIKEFSKATSLAQEIAIEKMKLGSIPADHKERWEAVHRSLGSEFRDLKDIIRASMRK